MPAAFNLPAGKTEDTQEFVLETARDRDRFIAAADLLPGNPAIVHDAIIFVRRRRRARDRRWPRGCRVRRRSAPAPASVSSGARASSWASGFTTRRRGSSRTRPPSDRSTVGLYLTKAPAREVRRLDLTASGERRRGRRAGARGRRAAKPRRAVRRGRAHRGGAPGWIARAGRRIRRRGRMGSALLARASD